MDVGKPTFAYVCALIQKGHRQDGHTPEQTLNRLFRKQLTQHKQEIAADLPASNTVTIEPRSKTEKAVPRDSRNTRL